MENKAWEYKGKKCIVLWVGTHFCGYGETSLRIGYSEGLGTCDTSPESNINAHGGLTFSGNHKELPNNLFDKDIWYFGFDCAHYGDYIDFEHASTNSILKGEHRWTEEEVVKETEKMVDDIIKYEELYPKFKKAFEEFKKEIEKIKNGE